MLRKALSTILGTAGPSAVESYYRELLGEVKVDGAPTRAEAQRDYFEALKSRYGRSLLG